MNGSIDLFDSTSIQKYLYLIERQVVFTRLNIQENLRIHLNQNVFQNHNKFLSD